MAFSNFSAMDKGQTNAWRAVWHQLQEGNPHFAREEATGVACAIQEIKRLQALDVPKSVKGDPMKTYVIFAEPHYLSIRCRPNDQDWDIEGIEIYTDPDCLTLIADGITLANYPASAQLWIYGALNAALHEARQALHKARRVAGVVEGVL